jgi:hypothetical protein
MRAAGIFVGVDRQVDIRIDALTYAGRDAQAFWGAFADANEAGGEGEEADTMLLVGVEATRVRVLASLATLAERTRRQHYDIAVIHFSCHGTEDGHLILADTLVEDVEGTALRISDVAAALAHMEAGAIVVVFESCFSGLAVGRTPSGDDGALRTLLGALARDNRAAGSAAVDRVARACPSPVLSRPIVASSPRRCVSAAMRAASAPARTERMIARATTGAARSTRTRSGAAVSDRR